MSDCAFADQMVSSHTHPDHVGNLRTADGGKALPRAVVHVPEADQAAADRLLELGFHYPFPGLGRMLRTEGGYVRVPGNWQF